MVSACPWLRRACLLLAGVALLIVKAFAAEALPVDSPPSDVVRPATELHFVHDVLPVLTKYGCNSGGCHGRATGQNGFKLSLFGFDPAADYAALVDEGLGRRIQLDLAR